MAGTEGNPAFVTRTDLEKLTNDFNEQLNENMSILRKEIITEVGSELRKQLAEFHHSTPGEPSVQREEEFDETDEEVVARLA